MKKGQTSKSKKPFCECECCNCDNCPDVMQKLALSTKGSKSACRHKTKHGGPKIKSKVKKPRIVPPPPPRRPSILELLDQNRTCNCEVVARAIRPNILQNLREYETRKNSSGESSSSKNDETHVQKSSNI